MFRKIKLAQKRNGRGGGRGVCGGKMKQGGKNCLKRKYRVKKIRYLDVFFFFLKKTVPLLDTIPTWLWFKKIKKPEQVFSNKVARA